MKYYVVNYLVFENRKIVENEWVGVPLHNFANTNDFRTVIANKKHGLVDPANIVIKSYKQVNEAEYYNEKQTVA